MKITGACHCGAIAYEAEIDPDSVVICHCTDCQTLSGSAFRVVVPAKKEDFKLLAGEPKIYVKTGESGRQRVQSFCSNCGTPIYSADTADPQLFSIRVGTAQQRAQLSPKLQLWCRSALGWAMHLEPVPQIATQWALSSRCTLNTSHRQTEEGGSMDPHALRQHFRAGLAAGLRIVWPVLSVLLLLVVGLGLLVGLLEGWSVQESIYFSFVTGLTIGYGDLAPKMLLTRTLAVLIGVCGLLVTAVIAAVTVKALTLAQGSLSHRGESDAA